MTPSNTVPCPVAAVVVTHRQLPEAGSLAATLVGADVPTVVVETGDQAAREQTEPYVVKVVPNVGYGSAINLGVARLLEAEHRETPTVLLILNADCQIDGPGINRLQQIATSIPEGTGAYGIRQTDADGDDADWIRTFPTARMYLETAARGKTARLCTHPRDLYPSGAVIAVATSVFASLQGFDPDFFLYFEETDFYRRLVSAGYAIHDLDGIAVVHTGAGATARYRWLTSLEFGRSSAIYGRKHAERFPTYGAAFLTYLSAYGAIKALRGELSVTRSALTHMAGFAVGALLPSYEPLAHTRLQAASISQRRAARRRSHRPSRVSATPAP